jgi:hypothetical protein
MTAYMTDDEAAELSHVLEVLTEQARRTGFRWEPMKLTTSLGADLTVCWSEENGGLYVVDFNAYWGQ